MILNNSGSDAQIEKEINQTVGRTYSFFQSLLHGGTGSQRLLVTEGSPQIAALFKLDNYPNYCNIEIRPKGIIVHFRSRLEMYNWIIPFTELKVTSDGTTWIIKHRANFIKVDGANNKPLDSKFLNKIVGQQLL